MALTQTQEAVGLHTVTASETANTILGMPYGASLPSIFIRVQYLSTLLTSGSGTLTFTAKVSYDRGVTWSTGATGAGITLSTTAQAGEQLLQVTPTLLPPDTGVVQIQVLATFGGSPVGQTAVYRADLLA